MWKQFLEVLSKIVTITQRTDKLEQVVKNQQQELRELTAFSQRLAFELQRVKDEQKHASESEARERKMLQLQLENQLLKAGRQLLPSSDEDKDNK